jgi:hypothetical protein
VLTLPNTPSRLPAKLVRDWLLVPLPLTGATLAAGLSLALRSSRLSIAAGYAAIALSLFYLAKVAIEALDGSMPDFIGLALVLVAGGYAGSLRGRAGAVPAAIWLLLAAPLAVALGTFNNQWAQLNFSMVFPFLALFVLASLDAVRWRSAAMLSLAILGPVAVMLLSAQYPYSLPDSLFEQQVAVQAPLASGTIKVDPETASFVRSARGLARGALLIDLSGMGPGIAAVLGAHAPVLPWLNPATPTWPDVVWSRLSPAERDRAWFVGPIWPQFVSTAPARWFAAHKARFCRRQLPPMTFWGEKRKLDLWRPCAVRAR